MSLPCKNDLSGYVCHNIYRNVQHRHARRYNRVVVLYYNNSIKDVIEIIDSPWFCYLVKTWSCVF